ncbi:HAMP domain-containing histidine kinase [Vibrio sp. ZSDE26]|uniref:histidine kinase n=1 Tax=Vibrio amylolyticus TaxID=2847292 RepID=A0A9X2BK26_9VIBR|nr:HAMP domain-containing sensor histidine kinase [Vibrio amylolyticus]MCK6264052.1 HAMP domain-containing histidine kinase [Vibrio amylolyticus]
MHTLLVFNLYLVYGLAFFAIFFSIHFQDLSKSRISLAHALPILATFGVLHGLHEWSELYLIIYRQEFTDLTQLKTFKTIKLWVSYIALGAFAWKMLSLTTWPQPRLIKFLISCILVLFISSLFLRFGSKEYALYLSNTSQQIRLIFGLGAGALAGLAIYSYANVLERDGHDASMPFKMCGIAFICYGFSTGVLQSNMGLWVIFIRTLCACAIWLTLLNALKVFEKERSKQIELNLSQSLHDAKLIELGELTSAVAHEVKTPLSSAMMSCDILERHLTDDEAQQRQLRRIRHGLTRAADISQEILNYAHQRPIKRHTVYIETLIQSALSLNQYRLENYKLSVDIENNLAVIGDAGLLEEVITNLLSNAIDATENGEKIYIQSKRDKQHAVILVSDHGGGMNPSTLSKATQPFFTTKPKGEGTGMGLAIVKQIVLQHNGALTLHNNSLGLTAEIRLPRNI